MDGQWFACIPILFIIVLRVTGGSSAIQPRVITRVYTHLFRENEKNGKNNGSLQFNDMLDEASAALWKAQKMTFNPLVCTKKLDLVHLSAKK